MTTKRVARAKYGSRVGWRTVSAKVSPDLEKRLHRMAAKRRVTVGELVLQILSEAAYPAAYQSTPSG